MEDYPKTMLEFKKRFNTEQSCQEYLYKMGWPEEFICTHCQHQEYWIMKRGQSQQYRCKRCLSWILDTAGTIFQDTHILLQVWFGAIWQVVSQKHGVSALGLQQTFGLSKYRTAWTIIWTNLFFVLIEEHPDAWIVVLPPHPTNGKYRSSYGS